MDTGQLELRELRYFLAVADSGSFTRGAAAVRVSQPALSQAIALLEQRLGCLLFERIGRAIRLTPAGEAFRDLARRLVCAADDVGAAMKEFLGARRGRLVVGAVQTVNACLIPRVLPGFLRRHAEIELQIEELSASVMEEAIIAGRLQVGVGFLPGRPEEIEFERAFEEDLIAVSAPPRKGAATPQRYSLETLAARRLILLGREFCTRRLIDSAFQAGGVAAQPALEMNSIEGILGVVRDSTYLTILPRLVLQTRAAAGLVAAPIAWPRGPLRRTLGILWRRGGYRSPLALEFTRAMQDVLHELQPASSPGR